MATVLLRLAGLDALDDDTEAEPPDGELGEVEQGVRTGEGHTIVGADRQRLSLCSYKDRRQVAKDMKAIYRAGTVEAAADRLDEFERLWGAKYPSVVAGGRQHWQEVIPMFAFAPEIRCMIYTTNAIESLHRSLRKIIKTRGHFPNDQAASKLLYLAIRNIEKGWKAAPKEWLPALNQLHILFGDRLRGES